MSQKIKTSVEVDGYLSADHLKISTSSLEPVDVGEIVWNQIDGTFDMGLIGGVTLQSGQEMHMYGKATQSISNGDAVMFAGVQGDHILIAKADSATINVNPEYFIGIATQSFITNDFGYVTVFGNVRGLNTTAYTLGTVLYYDSVSATDGLLRATVPNAPNAKIEVAAVVRVHATQGILLVRPHVMPKLKDLQDVHAPNPVNGNVLFWNSQLFRNEFGSISNILGYTPANDSQVVKLTGNQSIAGVKTFTSGTTVWNSASTNSLDFQSSGVTVASLIFNSSFTQFNSNASGGYIFKNSSANNSLSISDSGNGVFLGSLTASSFIKTGGTSAQILAADGSVITAGTGISISGGTISSTVVGGVTSFNTRTGAVTLTSTDVNTALGYTAANDANVVKLTGDQTIGGIKSFTLNNGAGDNFTFRINHFTSSGGITSSITPLEVINNNNPSTPFFKLDNAGNLTANSFVKIGGNSTQYLKADGSVSTAMNSRIEVNFVATAGQTTFTTPYEVGQIDVYYNGSKLYPNEFTATNGTTVVLAQAATLNAQISIVKYVAALSTSAIRNETTFTTISGQTTFSVNYTVGQVDVFYNGSKLNVSEFTATNGTLVVLGFACAAGESVVFVSYVNQVSGASGTANRVAKFTGAASLGDSQIFDNGTNVAIGSVSPISSSSLHVRGLASDPQNAFVVTTNSFSNLSNGSIIRIGHNAASGNTVANIQNLINGGSGIGDISFPTGNLGIGATSPKTTLQASSIGTGSLPSLGSIGTATSLYLTNNNFEYGLLMGSLSNGNSWVQSQRTDSSAIAYNLMLQPNGGNVLIGTQTNTGAKLNVVGAITSIGNVAFADDSGNGFQLLTATDPNRGLYMGYVYSGNYALIESIQQGIAYRNISINPNGGNVGIGIVVPTYKLQLGSDSAGKPNGGSWSNSSDSRLKENIETIKNPLNKICSLRGVTFDWIDESEQGGVKNSGGFIADEVMEVFPEWVSEITASEKQKKIIKDNKVKSLSLPFTFDAIVVESIKELNKTIQELKAEIEILKNK